MGMYSQIACFVLGFMTATCIIVTTCWNEWATSSPGASVSLLGAIWAFSGLWDQCMQSTTGQYQCDDYQVAMFQLPTHILGIRAMMCMSICFSVIGCFLLLIGMECSKLLDGNLGAKRKLMGISGVLFLLSGVLVLASVSWYTAIVINDFFSVF
uniref:Claudin n=1 Tax=Ciona savignyi TaxID=51511 RepID=H2Y935_CIOSA